MDERVAALMRAERLKRGIKQSTVAEKLELKNGSTISNWETGQATPSIDTYIAYCNACGISPGKLLTEALGDPSKMEEFHCTPDEAELIRRYRFIDERGKKTVRTVLDAEYNDALASLPEESPNATGTG